MPKIKIFSCIALAALVLISFAASGCFSKSKSTNSGSTNPTTTAPVTGIAKPAPVVVSVDDSTSGMEDNYYAVLMITVKNQGSSGTVIVSASLTQGSQTNTNQIITSLAKNTTQVIELVFPLKWLGGDWTTSVQASVP